MIAALLFFSHLLATPMTSATAEHIRNPIGGPAPITAPAVSLIRLDLFTRLCETRRVRYRHGAKMAALGDIPPADGCLDCSGFTQAALAYSSGGRLKVPAGSEEQEEWFASHGFARCGRLAAGADDGRLRICFHLPRGRVASGHVWLVYRRQTMECWGGHGVGGRFWNARTETGYRLSDLCDASFVLPLAPPNRCRE